METILAEIIEAILDKNFEEADKVIQELKNGSR